MLGEVMKVKIVNLKMLIDTQKISVIADNLDNYNNFNDTFPFVKNGTVNDKIKPDGLYKNAVINANNYKGVYEPIHTKTEFLEVMKMIYNQIGVKDMDNVDLNRIDIAVDSEINFKDNFKKILFMFELVTFGDKKADRWYTTNLKTLKNNTIILNGRSLEVCFYDKAEESGGKHYANTRFEFRFKRISSKEYDVHINKVKELVEVIDKVIPELEGDVAERLIKLWEEEKGTVKSFSEFVRKYNNFFYTLEIMEKVYKRSGLKANCKAWIKDFRKSNKDNVRLEFYSKSDVMEFKREVKKALKNYLKGGK